MPSCFCIVMSSNYRFQILVTLNGPNARVVSLPS